MTTAITQPKTVQELVSERIRASFVELFPEDQWVKMVQREINWFTTAPDNYHQQSHERRPSPLQGLIRTALEEIFRDKLKQELFKPEYMSLWNGNDFTVGPAMKQILEKALPTVAMSAFEGMVARMVKRIIVQT